MSTSTDDTIQTTDLIRVDDVSIHRNFGRPSTYTGRHSGKELAQIDLEVRVADEQQEQVCALFDKRTVTVNDPFARRSYQATFEMKMSSSYSGRYGTEYKILIRELDLPPAFETLEIGGKRFNVLGNVEYDLSEGSIARRVLLRLSGDQFEEARSALWSDEPVLVRRIGVDEAPLQVSFRGVNFWSKHDEEDEGTYYKKIVTFVPVEYPSGKESSARALAAEVQALQAMIVALTARVTRLLDELASGKTLTAEVAREILEGDWTTVLEGNKMLRIVDETTRVSDAAAHLELR